MKADWSSIGKVVAELHQVELGAVQITEGAYDPVTRTLDLKVTIQPPPAVVLQFTVVTEDAPNGEGPG